MSSRGGKKRTISHIPKADLERVKVCDFIAPRLCEEIRPRDNRENDSSSVSRLQGGTHLTCVEDRSGVEIFGPKQRKTNDIL